MSEYTFADLRSRYGTGVSYVIRGEGRNRVYGYRSGVMCSLGNIEVHEWRQLVQNLINQSGEQDLHQQLREFMASSYWKMDKESFEHYALELHAARIFDDPQWVDFIGFNSKYRPDVLQSTRLIWILPECCNKPGRIPYARLMKNQSGENPTCCPHCGRWSPFKLIEEEITERNSDHA